MTAGRRTDPLQLRLNRLPSVWACYPRVLFTSRPRIEELVAPREIRASVGSVRIQRRALERYVRVCGFEDASAAALVYPHVLAMPLHLRIFAMPLFDLRPMGLIHLSNVIESLATIEASMPLSIEASAGNYTRTDIGITFDVATTIESDGRPLWRETCVFLSRFSTPPATAARPARPPKAPRDARVLEELEVTLRTAWDYARVSGDYNPIHLNDRAARYFGLRGAIAHGLWSLARSMAQRPGAVGYPPGCRLDTQFLSPVQLPARVAIKEWQEEGALRRALCDQRTGRVHMYASLRASDASH